MHKSFLSIRDICQIAIFTAVIAVLSPMAIPMPYGVPLTLQSFIIPFSAVVLGARRGAVATIAYVLLGVVGLPVFSGFSGGAGMLIGPTGGFILAFPIYAWLAGWGADRETPLWRTVGLISGVVLFFLMGTLYFSLVMGQRLGVALAATVLPFIPTELLKLLGVWFLGPRVRVTLRRALRQTG